MTGHHHVLAKQILGKPDLESCTVDEIRELVDRYPYFAPASFLLLEKLRQTGDASYPAQKQKAVLYYHHPLAFEMFMNGEQFMVKLEPVEEEKEEAPEVKAENTAFHQPDEIELLQSEPAAIEHPNEPEVQPLIKIMTEAPAGELTFEPYHTVDYFASQGIKLSQDLPETDKFGKQLKSFTAWLKTMKKLPATEIARQMEPGSEANVVSMAADSIHNAEVLTESMAEVWVKQGNHARAREVYEKLSLQNPHKKDYFAAKIERLKP